MSNVLRKIMCPVCKCLKCLIGFKNNKKLLECGHIISFKKTKSEKDLDKKYIKTPWGFELR
jgi:hypothetical protein